MLQRGFQNAVYDELISDWITTSTAAREQTLTSLSSELVELTGGDTRIHALDDLDSNGYLQRVRGRNTNQADARKRLAREMRQRYLGDLRARAHEAQPPRLTCPARLDAQQ